MIFPLLIAKDIASQTKLWCSNVVRGSVHDAINEKEGRNEKKKTRKRKHITGRINAFHKKLLAQENAYTQYPPNQFIILIK